MTCIKKRNTAFKLVLGLFLLGAGGMASAEEICHPVREIHSKICFIKKPEMRWLGTPQLLDEDASLDPTLLSAYCIPGGGFTTVRNVPDVPDFLIDPNDTFTLPIQDCSQDSGEVNEEPLIDIIGDHESNHFFDFDSLTAQQAMLYMEGGVSALCNKDEAFLTSYFYPCIPYMNQQN